MSKSITISAANKNVRKEFVSIQEAKDYIIANKLLPPYGRDSITIAEVDTTIHEVKCDVPELSLDTKFRLIKSMKAQINKNEIYDIFINGYAYSYFNSSYEHNNVDKDLIESMLNIVINENQVNKEDLENLLKDKSLMRDELYKNPLYQKIGDNKDVKYQYCLLVLNKFEYNQSEFEFLKISTNFKPCNSICIHHRPTGLYFQFRANNTIVSSFRVVGRNVSYRSSNTLLEVDAIKLLKLKEKD